MASSDGVGIAHLPNQRHKIISKRGAHYTLMVCGNVESSSSPSIVQHMTKHLYLFSK